MSRVLIGQGETGRQRLHAIQHLHCGGRISDVQKHLADHVGDRQHLRLAHATGGDGRGSQSHTAALEGGSSLEGDGVLVGRDSRGV